MKRLFRKGDRVKIRDTKNVRQYNPEAVGKEIVLTDREYSDDKIDDLNSGDLYIWADNKLGVNFKTNDFEPVRESWKVVGYKVPFDMYTGSIKKGDILSTDDTDPYSSWKVNGVENEDICVPLEWARTWEKVYAIELKRGDKVVIEDFAGLSYYDQFTVGSVYTLAEDFSDSKLTLEVDDAGRERNGWSNSSCIKNVKIRLATSEEIRKADRITISGYDIEVGKGTIGFGCQTGFSLAHIEAYEKLLGVPGINIKIGDTDINETILRKIKTRLR